MNLIKRQLINTENGLHIIYICHHKHIPYHNHKKTYTYPLYTDGRSKLGEEKMADSSARFKER